MKLSLFATAAVLVFSTSALACPDLAGTYSCPNEDGAAEDMTVAQAVVDGVTVFTVTDAEGSYEMMADGVTRVQKGQTDTGNNATITESNTCNGSANLTTVASYNETDPTGKSVASFNLVQVVSRDAATGGLALNVRYSENGGAEQVASGVCAKK
jgi:hypothetical protein